MGGSMAVDITTLVSILLSQAPLATIIILVLILYAERKFNVVENRLESMLNFNEALLLVLLSRGAISDSEYKLLSLILPSSRVSAGSRYYTKDVERRLHEIIDRLTSDPRTATWDDVLELERIYDVLWDEIDATRDRKRRRELIALSVKVKVMAVMTKVYLIGRGVMPAWVKGHS
jgi:hypothetical protein